MRPITAGVTRSRTASPTAPLLGPLPRPPGAPGRPEPTARRKGSSGYPVLAESLVERRFRSVEGFRRPINSAQGTGKVPAGNFLGRVPGTTTLRGGTTPLWTTSVSPVTSMIGVEPVRTTPAPRTACSPTRTPSTTMQREPMKAPSSMMTGAACSGSRTPPMPTPPDRCTPRPIWAQEPTVAQVSTMLPAPTQAPMLT